eukprot:TRINITY_DN2912_c0_g1_i1.p1 TRINITY_DN2912_c0_g1~~TRINITY_DN2912_c0_g1_i1.p1  ORF type:complete len:463 (-),score=107.32 TRINITY_DN2912_c0_g1_i1:118-1506(-)
MNSLPLHLSLLSRTNREASQDPLSSSSDESTSNDRKRKSYFATNNEEEPKRRTINRLDQQIEGGPTGDNKPSHNSSSTSSPSTSASSIIRPTLRVPVVSRSGQSTSLPGLANLNLPSIRSTAQQRAPRPPSNSSSLDTTRSFVGDQDHLTTSYELPTPLSTPSFRMTGGRGTYSLPSLTSLYPPPTQTFTTSPSSSFLPLSRSSTSMNNRPEILRPLPYRSLTRGPNPNSFRRFFEEDEEEDLEDDSSSEEDTDSDSDNNDDIEEEEEEEYDAETFEELLAQEDRRRQRERERETRYSTHRVELFGAHTSGLDRVRPNNRFTIPVPSFLQGSGLGSRQRITTPLPRIPPSFQNSPDLRSQYLHLALLGRDITENDYELLLQLDDAVPNKTGAQLDQIKTLPCFSASGDESIECSICLSPIEVKESMKELPCNHRFHSGCIDKWLVINNSCPIDKLSVDYSKI